MTLRMYDLALDEHREPTQADIDHFETLVQQLGNLRIGLHEDILNGYPVGPQTRKMLQIMAEQRHAQGRPSGSLGRDLDALGLPNPWAIPESYGWPEIDA